MRRLGFASFVVGAVLAACFTVLLIMNLPSSPQPVGSGQVHLTDDGLKIYASRAGVRPACEVKTAANADVPLEVPSGSETLTVGGRTWFLIARSVDKVPPGDYQVNCVEIRSGTRSGTTIAVGARGSIGVFVVAILGLVFSVVIFVALGTILLAVSSRRNRKNGPGNTFPTNQGGYPQPGHPHQQPGYPHQQPGQPQPGGPQYGPGQQQGNAFPGYPPPSTYNPGPNPDRPPHS